MDLNSLFSALSSADSVSGIAKAAGVSESEVQSVMASALPSMLSGAQMQAAGPDTIESFAKALSKHSKTDTSDLGSFFGKVDVEDGNKILGHLLGADQEAVTKTAATRAGLGSNKTMLIMALLAPLLLGKLGQGTNASAASASPSLISSLVGSMLGGGSSNAGMGGSLLGSLLGGGSSSSGMGGSLLGSMLGGGSSYQQPVYQQPVQQAQPQPQTISLTQEQYQALLQQLQAQQSVQPQPQAQPVNPSINLGQTSGGHQFQPASGQSQQSSSGGGLLGGLMSLLRSNPDEKEE
jgi:hypothetical protein